MDEPVELEKNELGEGEAVIAHFLLESSIYVKRGNGSKKYKASREGTVNLAEVQNTLEGLGTK